jgi:hypothetical protein
VCQEAPRPTHLLRSGQLHARAAQVLPLAHKLSLHLPRPAQQAVLAGGGRAGISHHLGARVAAPAAEQSTMNKAQACGVGRQGGLREGLCKSTANDHTGENRLTQASLQSLL